MIINNKKYLITLLTIYTILGLAANLAHPVTPQLIKSLSMPAYMFGLAFSLMQMGTFLFSPFWGVLSTIIQPRLVLLIGGIGYALGQYLFSISTTASLLLSARFISGVSVSASTVASLYMLVQLTDGSTRKKWMPFLVTSFLVAGTFGQFLGGIIGVNNILYPFYVQIALLILCGLAYFLMMPNLENRKQIGLIETLQKSNPIKAFFSIKDHLNKEFIIQFIIVFILSFGATSVSQTFGYYLVDVFGKGSEVNGYSRGITGFLSLALNALLVSKIVSKFNRSKIILYVSAIMATSTLMMILNANVTIYFIVFAIIAMSFDTVTVSALQEKSSEMAHDEIQGVVLGTHNSMKSLGAVLGATVAGFIYDINVIFPFVMALILYILVIILIKKQIINDN